jgi:hypothetical protein
MRAVLRRAITLSYCLRFPLLKPSVSDMRAVPDGAGGRVLSSVRIRGEKIAHRVVS